jgi:riboflavin synthase
MFTGLIETVGTLVSAEKRGAEARFLIRPAKRFDAVVLGESIAVNGVCLTVETWEGGVFTAYASGETLSRTNLGGLGGGARVNLERALALGDRLGGHLVSGHVDCLASVESIDRAGESTVYRLGFPEEHGPLVVEKGSVALDGISLTVNECGPDFLTVNIIPATQAETTIGDWAAGTRINMETDLLGKYVQRMLGPWLARAGAKPSAITEEFLREHGF